MNSPTTATMVMVLLALSLGPVPTLRADDLDGRVYLGKGLDIELEEKESLISEFLRYLKLKKSPRRVVNLSQLGKKGDGLFVGEDMNLYFSSEKEGGAAFPIGSASKLWKFRVDDDVEFSNVADVSKILDPAGGAVTRKLRVKTTKNRPRAHNAQQTSFEFWLKELVFEYDRYNPRRKTDENYPYIAEAIRTALPGPNDMSEAKLDNLTFLHRYVRKPEGMDLIPLRKLISDRVKELEAVDTPQDLLAKFKEVEQIIFKKTEGL